MWSRSRKLDFKLVLNFSLLDKYPQVWIRPSGVSSPSKCWIRAKDHISECNLSTKVRCPTLNCVHFEPQKLRSRNGWLYGSDIVKPWPHQKPRCVRVFFWGGAFRKTERGTAMQQSKRIWCGQGFLRVNIFEVPPPTCCQDSFLLFPPHHTTHWRHCCGVMVSRARLASPGIIHTGRARNASKWDLLMWMGVSTLNTSNIKGFAFEFVPERCVDEA